MKFDDFRWPLVVFLWGYLIQLTRALFKVRHWPVANEMGTDGYAFCAIAIFFAMIKIVLIKKPGK